jgi:hypothetical protein
MSKSRWDSDFWKAVKALSLILTVIVSLLTILQLLGQVDVYNLIVVPIVNFFMFPVPLVSIPLAFLIVLAVLFGWAYLGDRSSPQSNPISVGNPFYRADILDAECVRYVAHLCKTPQTADFIKQKYEEFRERYGWRGGYSSEDLLKELEERGLLVFQNEKWEVTQKALAYIAKYHGGK